MILISMHQMDVDYQLEFVNDAANNRMDKIALYASKGVSNYGSVIRAAIQHNHLQFAREVAMLASHPDPEQFYKPGEQHRYDAGRLMPHLLQARQTGPVWEEFLNQSGMLAAYKIERKLLVGVCHGDALMVQEALGEGATCITDGLRYALASVKTTEASALLLLRKISPTLAFFDLEPTLNELELAHGTSASWARLKELLAMKIDEEPAPPKLPNFELRLAFMPVTEQAIAEMEHAQKESSIGEMIGLVRCYGRPILVHGLEYALQNDIDPTIYLLVLCGNAVQIGNTPSGELGMVPGTFKPEAYAYLLHELKKYADSHPVAWARMKEIGQQLYRTTTR